MNNNVKECIDFLDSWLEPHRLASESTRKTLGLDKIEAVRDYLVISDKITTSLVDILINYDIGEYKEQSIIAQAYAHLAEVGVRF